MKKIILAISIICSFSVMSQENRTESAVLCHYNIDNPALYDNGLKDFSLFTGMISLYEEKGDVTIQLLIFMPQSTSHLVISPQEIGDILTFKLKNGNRIHIKNITTDNGNNTLPMFGMDMPVSFGTYPLSSTDVLKLIKSPLESVTIIQMDTNLIYTLEAETPYYFIDNLKYF